VSLYAVTRPEIPYNTQISPEEAAGLLEQGFNDMRGALTG
jgi:phospholipase C